MNCCKYLTFVFTLCFPVLACTEENNSNTQLFLAQNTQASSPVVSAPVGGRRTLVLESGDILVVDQSADGKPVASYISTKAADQEQVAQRLLTLLQQTQTSESFLKSAETKLPKNRRLKKDNFNFTMREKDGTGYTFSYMSDIELSIFILSYQFEGKSSH